MRIQNKNSIRNLNRILEIVIFIAILLFLQLIAIETRAAYSVPAGPNLLYNYTEIPTPQSALIVNTSGGTITTMNLFGITQNPHWKAYVGNVSGKLALQDASTYTIYDWAISRVSGEVYATRNSVTPSWTNIRCANSSELSSEETFFNMSSADDDSISKTFNSTTHKSFFVGTKPISSSTCFATYTYIQNQSQSPSEEAKFQEIILSDGANLIFATLLENKSVGFNNQTYDFQMLLPESKLLSAPNTAYYFYLELT
ncbi:MAG: hypothetical protein ACP5OZ_02850 [Candidatus Woesearchaeota archaeon]